jgi:CBS domain-containing protein
VSGSDLPGARVSDAMLTCPKTHDHESTVDDIRGLFEDDHVQMALIVGADGRLLSTIERQDLDEATPGSASVRQLGTLAGRTVGPAETLAAATATLSRRRRRRLAVVERSGRLLGLLCLKRDGTGYCSDQGVRERATTRGRSA